MFLPCLYQAQICWNTYFEVPAQDLLHHQNQQTAFAPDLMFSNDPSLKIWLKKPKQTIREHLNQAITQNLKINIIDISKIAFFFPNDLYYYKEKQSKICLTDSSSCQ